MSDTEKEMWEDIVGFEGLYQISSIGRVKSLSREVLKSNGRIHTVKESIRALHETKDGYLRVRLGDNLSGKSFLVHRLVAEHFLENPQKKLEVNHIDENKKNNCVTNLEWCTREENVKHSSWYLSNMHQANFRKVFSIDKNGERLTFSSIKEMAETLGIKIPTAHTYVQNSRKMVRGKFEGWVFGYEKSN